jgi:proteasome lid subunit RPN8/RPN11
VEAFIPARRKAGSFMLNIPKTVFDGMLEDAKSAYPDECCGVLVGKGKDVREARRVENINRERSRDRYEVDPAELLKAEKEARTKGFAVIGIYHSHPDHPPAPSEFDRSRAWPDYSYVIVSVKGGVDTQARSWTLDDNGYFTEERIAVK